MKKNLLVSLTILCSLLLFSCKKTSTNTNTSGTLGAGKSSISFTSSANFAGSTTFNQSNTIYTQAISGVGSSVRNIALTATEVNGTNTRIVVLDLVLPQDASTSSGNLTADFSLPSSATIYPTLELTSTSGTTPGPGYTAESGTLTITKLTSSEIEGTFNNVVVNDGASTSFTLTNGHFAGKFN
ncbi:MAG: hypothetical protein JWN78_167 [Bacteroidota bacterium]|nr:hypothetical protein [Bacteroidota bacterium]